MTGSPDEVLPSSFRDPSGFLFQREGILYRQVNRRYRDDWELLTGSGLLERLTTDGLLIPHEEADVPPADPDSAYKVIRPEPLPFISHPYEWCFGQLHDAALLTLRIQQLALEHGMSLKDASAFNIQFHHGRPVLIDTLSFERCREGQPWVAYRQFCQHFLAPLALAAHRDIRLLRLTRLHLDGVPLDLASRLLPRRTHWSFGLKLHIHIHARSQARHADRPLERKVAERQVSRQALLGLIDSLETAVRKLEWKPPATEWGEYYEDTNYTPAGLQHKARVVEEFIAAAGRLKMVWDFGANDGRFSRLASGRGLFTVAADIDPVAVEKNWRMVQRNREEQLLPLWMDLTNPSPAIGWAQREREGLIGRGPADLGLALALVHHLAIGNNLPLDLIARYFAETCRKLVIEWVPKEDSQVQRLLATREDIFDRYTQGEFERAFSKPFRILKAVPVQDSARVLYLMERIAE